MTRKALKTAKDYAQWKRKNEEREQRLLQEELPWESDDPEARESWEAWCKQSRQRDREVREKELDANARELTENGIDNAISGDNFTLTKEEPIVNMVGLRWKVNEQWLQLGPSKAKRKHIPKLYHSGDPPELIVTGLGQYAGKRRARVAPVEMTTFDLSNRTVEQLGITSDAKLVLPNTAARVLFVLKDPKRAGTTVTLNRENQVSRGDWPLPKDWLVRKQWKEPKGDA